MPGSIFFWSCGKAQQANPVAQLHYHATTPRHHNSPAQVDISAVREAVVPAGDFDFNEDWSLNFDGCLEFF